LFGKWCEQNEDAENIILHKRKNLFAFLSLLKAFSIIQLINYSIIFIQ